MMPAPSAPVYPYNKEYEEDERLARELYQQERDAQMARDLEAQLQREADLQRNNTLQHHDAVVAQALQDEDYARQVARQEEQRALQQAQAEAVTPSRRRRICTSMIPILIIGMGAAGLYFAMRATNVATGTAGGISIPGFPPFLRDSDPFDGLAPGEVARWRTRGNNGLQLEILNALTSDWNAIFTQVVSDWDQGTPDVLDLLVAQATPDSVCEAIEGVSKICNGNYGETEWKGINMAVLQLGYIYASVSQMNEHYLKDANTPQRRYTLCHEMGHSFGLPHTDEDFYNADLGNCMDYTSNPKANQSPDHTNFAFLQELYGVLPLEDSGNRTRSLRQSTLKNIPPFVHTAMEQAVQREPTTGNNNRELRVQQGMQAQVQMQTIHLQEGWTLQIQKLIA